MRGGREREGDTKGQKGTGKREGVGEHAIFDAAAYSPNCIENPWPRSWVWPHAQPLNCSDMTMQLKPFREMSGLPNLMWTSCPPPLQDSAHPQKHACWLSSMSRAEWICFHHLSGRVLGRWGIQPVPTILAGLSVLLGLD